MRKNKRLKILSVVGARPNLVKMSAISNAIKRCPEIKSILLHTGQHYDYQLHRVFFKDLELPTPHINLGVGSDTDAKQIAKIMSSFAKALKEISPDLVIVFGDVNSTLACALVSAQEKVSLAHVEAGLRSFDPRMPEELNRTITDSVSDYLFTTCEDANKNLIQEGMDKKRIFLVGNVMIDTLLRYKEKIAKSNIIQRLKIRNEEFILLTLHRSENVDDRVNLESILAALKEISHNIRIIYPLHPRARKQLQKFRLMNKIKSMKNLELLKPCGYLDFIKLLSKSELVLTDSGGVQEETTVLGIPCLTLRQNTERPVTVKLGTNKIIGIEAKAIILETERILNGSKRGGKIPPFWDGKAAERIIKVLIKDKSLR